jgi:pimeloyl-ACP methyl ester carboxylesterase
MKLKRILHNFFILWIGCLLVTLSYAQPEIQVNTSVITTNTGALTDGTAYRIDYPDNFNGTLLIGLDYAARQYQSQESQALLSLGYAMAGVTRIVTGWDVEASASNHLSTLDIYNQLHGSPRQTLLYGRSLGAHSGVAIVHKYADRFDGALLACGGLGGAVAIWNGKFDALFIAKTLLAETNSELKVLDIPDDFATTTRPAWLEMLAAAQTRPEGRARIALAAVIAQLPTWSDASKQQPASSDLTALQDGLYDSLAGSPLPTVGQAMSSRNEINRRSGGSISFNAGVNYREILRGLRNSDIVYELYRQAGLDINIDLDKLEQAPRVSADLQALTWIAPQVWDGGLTIPVLTLNNIGDNISTVSSLHAFQETVNQAGSAALLRQVYVNSAGHCAFSPAESIAAINTLVQRVNTGEWGMSTNPYTLNSQAEALDIGPARFITYQPEPFARAFDACDLLKLDVEVESSEINRQCSAD